MPQRIPNTASANAENNPMTRRMSGFSILCLTDALKSSQQTQYLDNRLLSAHCCNISGPRWDTYNHQLKLVLVHSPYDTPMKAPWRCVRRTGTRLWISGPYFKARDFDSSFQKSQGEAGCQPIVRGHKYACAVPIGKSALTVKTHVPMEYELSTVLLLEINLTCILRMYTIVS